MKFRQTLSEGTDPIGQRVAIDQLIPGVPGVGPTVEWQIVGVFHNVPTLAGAMRTIRRSTCRSRRVPGRRRTLRSVPSAIPPRSARFIAAVVNSMDADLALAYLKTMEQIADENLSSDRFASVLYASFAGVALLLAAIGIYGVMAFAVAQRTHEIGLRMALGAGREQVLRLVLTEGMMLALAGLALGLVGACFVGRAMRSMLYGVGTVDRWAFALVAAALLTSAGLAC